MGLFDSLLKKKQAPATPATPPDDGYEAEGNRSTEVNEPSFADNFRFGMSGDARKSGTRGLPNSWGEGLGRLAKMNAEQSQGPNPQPAQKKQQFGGLFKLLGM